MIVLDVGGVGVRLARDETNDLNFDVGGGPDGKGRSSVGLPQLWPWIRRARVGIGLFVEHSRDGKFTVALSCGLGRSSDLDCANRRRLTISISRSFFEQSFDGFFGGIDEGGQYPIGAGASELRRLIGMMGC